MKHGGTEAAEEGKDRNHKGHKEEIAKIAEIAKIENLKTRTSPLIATDNTDQKNPKPLKHRGKEVAEKSKINH